MPPPSCPGEVPGIHVGRHRVLYEVDGRDKPGHDELCFGYCRDPNCREQNDEGPEPCCHCFGRSRISRLFSVPILGAASDAKIKRFLREVCVMATTYAGHGVEEVPRESQNDNACPSS